MDNLQLSNYIRQSELSIVGPLWIDESFEKKLKDISEDEAFYKPFGELNSIAQILFHLTEWKKSIVQLYKGDPDADRPANNGIVSNEDLKAKGWQMIKDEFHNTQDAFIDLLKQKDDSFLKEEFADTEYPNQYFIEGLIHHDLYHLGQIGTVIRLIQMGK